MHPRQRLRLSTLPDLYDVGRRPSVAQTTTTDITDDEIGLTFDPVAQVRAEEAIRCAYAFWSRQSVGVAPRRPFQAIAIRIALAADDQEDDLTMLKLVETLVPAGARFDA